MAEDARQTQIPVLHAALHCVCPSCGNAPLFDGFLGVWNKCPACDLDYTNVDSGDGPAVFIILIVGFIVAISALVVETSFTPPYWVHAVLWVPLTLGLGLGLLRPFKATLIALQFKHKAAEGKLHPNGR